METRRDFLEHVAGSAVLAPAALAGSIPADMPIEDVAAIVIDAIVASGDRDPGNPSIVLLHHDVWRAALHIYNNFTSDLAIDIPLSREGYIHFLWRDKPVAIIREENDLHMQCLKLRRLPD